MVRDQADLSRPIGIRNVEASEDRGLETFHHLRLLRGPVIIADEVKEPVHGKMREVLRKRLCLHVRFALKRLIRNDNVAEQARLSGRGVSGIDREGQHVGRHILLAPVAIEHAHGLVIAEHDGNLALAHASRSRRPPDGTSQHCSCVATRVPQRSFHPDFDDDR